MNIDSWLTDTITVASRIGADSYGQPTYGAQVAIPARVESKLTLMLSAQGANLNSDHVIVTTTLINPDDQIWLPGDDIAQSAKARRPLKITNAYVKSGAFTLYETYL